MASLTAHLNGGPLDDQYRPVFGPEHRIPLELPFLYRMDRLPVPGPDDPARSIGLSFRMGRYVLRIDGNGQPVPHNLEGVMEYDYDMNWTG